jgi:hypothetical protein
MAKSHTSQTTSQRYKVRVCIVVYNGKEIQFDIRGIFERILLKFLDEGYFGFNPYAGMRMNHIHQYENVVRDYA